MANPEDLGRYRLKRLLGRGALGEVWEATDLDEAGAKVAVKIMHAADDELAFARIQFAREARLAALLRHPHVVAVHDAGEAAGTSFMVMDMVEGKSLRKALSDPSVTVAEKLRWLFQIGAGLAAMHEAGIAHRDLKPENVIVRTDRTACIVDLGVAKWRKFDLGGECDPMVALEQLEITPVRSDYAPPETTATRLYDELGDQYAWGIVAYELLTGQLPTEGSPPLTERDDVPGPVAAAIDRARATDRQDRWDAMSVLLDELAEHVVTSAPEPEGAAEPEEAPAPGRPGGAGEPHRGRAPVRVAAGIGALLLLVVVGLVVAALR